MTVSAILIMFMVLGRFESVFSKEICFSWVAREINPEAHRRALERSRDATF